MEDAATLELARRLRGELPHLLPAQDVDRVAGALTELIERGEAGEPVAMPILRLLRDHDGLRRRANELAPAVPVRNAVVPPPGLVRIPLAPRYVCPNGDFEYFRRDVAQLVPACPHDGADLVPEGQE